MNINRKLAQMAATFRREMRLCKKNQPKSPVCPAKGHVASERERIFWGQKKKDSLLPKC